MSLILARDFVLTVPAGYDDVTADNPIIGYNNIVDVTTILSDLANTSYPITNVANPATFLFWKSSSTAVQYITIPVPFGSAVTYIGIAKHNLGTDQTPITIEQYNGSAWSTLVATAIPANDSPLLFRFNALSGTMTKVRIKLAPNTLIPYIGVVYAGDLFVLPRRIYVSHTPFPMGRQTNVVNGMSASGNFLGRIVLGEVRSTSFTQKHVSPTLMRTKFDPFFDAAQEKPFFFAWRPLTYPNEVGYCWTTVDAKPENQLPNGMMQVGFNLTGVK